MNNITINGRQCTPETIYVDDVIPFGIIKNVATYTSDPEGWILTTNNDLPITDDKAYFIIDSLYHDGFYHWVYENSVFIMYYEQLLKLYPNLKIVCKLQRNFKDLFYKMYGVTDNVDYSLPNNNLCIIPLLNMFTNQRKEHTDTGKMIIRKMMSMFRAPVNLNRTIDYLVMPRQTKENYIGNNRVVDMTNIYAQLRDKKYVELHTDTITNLQTQIDMINNSKTIIITDGSPFLVNGMFVESATIIVIPYCTQDQAIHYPKLRFVVEEICKYNTVIYSRTIL